MNDNSKDAMHPIALLVDELRSDDLTLRLNSIKRLSMIALALGPERTRVDLLSFLHESLDDDDEILLALATELDVNFVEYVGGPQYASSLFEPLEALAGMEETLVRDRASESISNIAKVMTPSQILEKYLPMLQRLAHGEWFASRVSVAPLYVPAYEILSKSNLPEAPAVLNELRTSFKQLSQDDTPMVRRAVTKAISGFAAALSQIDLNQLIVPMLRKLATDEQDSVRLLVVEALASVTKLLANNPNQVEAIFGDTLKSLAVDEAWRVRYMMANKIQDMVEASQKSPQLLHDLVPIYINLLQDPEAEVRTAAANHIPEVAVLLNDPHLVVDKLLPIVNLLTSDESQHVRTAVATQAPALAPLIGVNDSQEFLVPTLLRLLKDEFPDVRLAVISKLDKVHPIVGLTVLSQALLPAIIELAEDKQWRVRQAIMEHIPLLAEQLGVQHFNQQLGDLAMRWLQDPVYAVRDAACLNLHKLVHVFGIQWAKTFVIPRILDLAASPAYLTRLTTLFAIAALAPSLDQETIRSLIVNTVLNFKDDHVPNIRFNVAKALEILTTTLPESPVKRDLVKSDVLPCLRKFTEDRDPDVRFFGDRAIQTIIRDPSSTDVTMANAD